MTENNQIETLFKRHYARLYALAFSMLKDNELSRDVINDVFTEILTTRIVGEISEGYLSRSIYNHCLNTLRNMAVKERVTRCLKLEYDFVDDNVNGELDERLMLVQTVIREKLPPKCSQVMLLRYEERLSYKEIAEALGISEVAVYKHLKNGINYLRKHLTD